MGLFGKGRNQFASDDELREKKKSIADGIDWSSGSILDGDFDDALEKIDEIDEELNKRSWDRAKKASRDETKSYGVRRTHGWYLPNDDDD